MRSVVFRKFGPPAEVLELDEQPLPTPGPGQVRLRLVQSPIHNHDLAIIRGVYGYKPTLPAIPGTEALGVVDQVGPEVDTLVVGQRVTAAGLSAAWAEFFLARAAAVVPVPAAIPDDVACQLLAMPLSAYMVLDDLGLKAGEWIIQNAAGGAVGRLIDCLAGQRDLNVINLVRRKTAVSQLEALGAKHVLSTDDPAWAKQVPKLTGGAPVLRALDSVGGKASNDLMNVLGFEGVLLSFGALSGEPMVIDVSNVLFKQAVVKGFWATKRAERTTPADNQRMIGDLMRLAAHGRLPLQVEATFALRQAAEAVVASEKPGRSGKIALRPD